MAKAEPTHASMYMNHRRAFKAKHGHDWQGTDDELATLIEAVGALASSAETDEAILEDMEAFVS